MSGDLGKTSVDNIPILIYDATESVLKGKHIIPDKPHKTKKPTKEPKRKVKLRSIGNTQTLIITQKVKLTEPTFKCIINVNTNIFDRKHKSDHHRRTKDSKRKKCKKALKKSHLDIKERIVPVCFRSSNCCRTARQKTIENLGYKHKDTTFNDRKCHGKTHRKSLEKQKVYNPHRETIKYESEKKHQKPKRDISLSISRQQNHGGNSMYEDISEDDNICNLEDEIDLLIKRTKERERNMVREKWLSGAEYLEPISPSESLIVSPSNENNHSPKGTPDSSKQYFEPISPYSFVSSPKCPSDKDNATVFSSEMDVSIHSLSTVVLRPDITTDAYSPTLGPYENFDEGLPNFTEVNEPFLGYSYVTNSRSDYIPVKSQSQDSVETKEVFNNAVIKQEYIKLEVIENETDTIENIEIDSQIIKVENIKQESFTS